MLQVVKQSLDVASLLHAVSVNVTADYYMFMEDDLSACANMLSAVSYALRKVRVHVRGSAHAVRAGCARELFVYDPGLSVLP
jgi:hypothetical protein